MADRLAFRVSFAFCILTSSTAARLAAEFRRLGSAGPGLWPAALVLQLPVLACWLVVRPLSLGSFALCSSLALRLDARRHAGLSARVRSPSSLS